MKYVSESYNDWLSNELLNIKSTQKLGKEHTNNMYLSSSSPMLFWPRIGEWKLSWSARWNMFLKPTIISFRMSHWTLKMPKNWVRTNLCKVPTWLMIWQSSWFSDGAVMDSWWPQLRYRCISLQSVTQCGYFPWLNDNKWWGQAKMMCNWIVTWVTLSKKGNFTLVIQVTPRLCSGHTLIIWSQTGSQQDCKCCKFNNDTSNDQIVVEK